VPDNLTKRSNELLAEIRQIDAEYGTLATSMLEPSYTALLNLTERVLLKVALLDHYASNGTLPTDWAEAQRYRTEQAISRIIDQF